MFTITLLYTKCFNDVYFKSKLEGVNVEEGMLGLSKDPDFKNNHWVYIYLGFTTFEIPIRH